MSEWLDDIASAGASTVNYWKELWIHDAVENHARLKRYLASGKAIDIVKHPRVTHAPAYLLASGPSLDDTPWGDLMARQAEGAAVFAATSNVITALANGITPDYIIVVDANPSVASHVKPVLDRLCGTTLLTSPLIEPKLIKDWPGPIALFRPLQHGDDFIMNALPKMYSTRHEIDATHRVFVEWINASFLNAGCVTNAMVLAASFLGYDPLFMLGNDLGFPNGRLRCATYTRDGDSFVADPQPPVIARELLRTANNGVRTISEYLHYKLNLFIAWRLTPIHLYNCSTIGIIHDDEVPRIDVKTACGYVEGSVDGPDGSRIPASALGWEHALHTYPMDIGGVEWGRHVEAICARMGMMIKPVNGGFQIQAMTTGNVMSVPTTGVTSTSTRGKSNG